MQAHRKPAPRQARPAQRYFPGKAPKGVQEHSESESDEEQVLADAHLDTGNVPIGGELEDAEDEGDQATSVIGERVSGPSRGMNVALKNVSITQGGNVIIDGREESQRMEMEESEEESGGEEADEKGSEAESSRSEYETESEEDVKPQAAFRPVFVPKRARATLQERDAVAENTEGAQAKREEEAAQRKKESHNLVAESITRELAEKEVKEIIPDVDDTDGLNPTLEFEEWRLRELSRIKRDKEAQVKREEEREDIERRRALPEAQRLAEDLEHAEKLRKEKPKGKQKFLQKYYHKGAFHQDVEVLKRHDFTEATESTVNMTLLPKVMQVKNFGKRSQTKYTHLLDQDTTRDSGGFGGTGSLGKPGLTCFNCGGAHLRRDCPHADTQSGLGTGANETHPSGKPGKQWGIRKDQVSPAPPSGPRHWRDRPKDDSYGRSREDDDGRYRRDDDRGVDGDRNRNHHWDDRGLDKRGKRSYSRSVSPHRVQGRSRSIEHSDKRRRRD